MAWKHLLLLFLVFGTSYGGNKALQNQLIRKFQRRSLYKQFEKTLPEPLPDLYFENRRDHFDPTNDQTYRQRYWLNQTFWKPGGAVFLCVGGEGPAMNGYILNFEFVNALKLAPEFNAAVFLLEHRYYGKSNVTKDLKTENLKWLGSQHALADIVYFVQAMKTKGYDGRWVTFGGSYPGMLSGWARIRYPNLIYASVASSAPVQAEVDMVGYLDIVADALANPQIGGSEKCLSLISQGHALIGDMLRSTNGQSDLLKKFNFCANSSLSSHEAQLDWAQYGVLPIDAQDNREGCETDFCNIEKVCEAVTNSSMGTVLDNFAYISTKFRDGDCIEIDDSEDNFIFNTTISDNSWLRVWTFQTCAEFGFFQTCENGSRCPFVQGLLKLDYYYENCMKAFGITSDEIAKNVKYSNGVSGGNTPVGSRVIWPNGAVDPWHNLSVLEPPEGQKTLMVEGASHCEWMLYNLPFPDTPELMEAQKTIQDSIRSWLLE